MILNLKHLKLEEINLLEIKWKKNRRKSRKRPKIKKLWEQSTEQLLATCLPVSFQPESRPKSGIHWPPDPNRSGVLKVGQTKAILLLKSFSERGGSEIQRICNWMTNLWNDSIDDEIIQIQSRSMSYPSLSDNDFKSKWPRSELPSQLILVQILSSPIFRRFPSVDSRRGI